MKNLLYLMVIWVIVVPVPAAADDRPNIIFFLTDDQRFDQMGCAGHEILQTPTMDDLASRGTRFENAFVTTPICAASRASLLTGTPERTHGYTFGKPPVPEPLCQTSYPAVLREAGYQTGFIGKFGMRVPDGAVAEMFDVFRTVGRGPYFRPMPDGTTRHETDLITDHAITFLRDRDQDSPFCVSLSFNAPHAEDGDKKDHFPWPPSADGMYEECEIPSPRLGDPTIFESQPAFLQESLNRQRWFWRWDTPEKYDRNMRAYFRMISGIDAAMARVLNELEALDLADNTVIIFSSDNGYYLGDRGFAGKWSHYEQSLRVPLIIMDPRLDPGHRGRVSPAMALNTDIAPTIIEIAGEPVPASHEGRSLVPWFTGESANAWRSSFRCEHLMNHAALPKWRGVRGDRYVYARYFEQDPAYEFLHDLETDPDQLVNLVDDPAHAAILQRMRRMVSR